MKATQSFATSLASLACLFSALLLSSCAGYQFGDAKPSVYGSVQTIYVPPFTNQTLEPRLSSLVTNAVIKEIQRDGTYRIGSKGNCDAILVGSIHSFTKSQLRATRTDTLRSRELNLRLRLDFKLVDPATMSPITESSASSITEAERDAAVTQNNEEEGFIRARQGTVYGTTIQFIEDAGDTRRPGAGSFQVGERSALSLAGMDAAKRLVSQIANGF